MTGRIPATAVDASANPPPAWWLCADETTRRQTIDRLCAQGWAGGRRVGVSSAPESVLSNLCGLENILLPAAWHGAGRYALDPAVSAWLDERLGADAASRLLLQRGDELAGIGREAIGMARVLQLRATLILIEDGDEANEFRLLERIERFAALLPAATIGVASTRAPSRPQRWRVLDTSDAFEAA